jgi:Tfp pilus assembly protein PilF
MKAIHSAMAIRSTPEDRVVLARIQRRLGAVANAYEQLDLAVAAAPEDKAFRLERALWLLEDGKDEEALAVVAPMLAQDPGDTVALWVRGTVFLRRGETARAREDFAAGAQSRADLFAAAVCRGMLEQLASRP